MPIKNRTKVILQHLESEGSVSVADLSRKLSVSEATIRRDLDALHEEKKLKRVHGGAIFADHLENELPVKKRISQFETEKQTIASEASKLINHGDTIFLGSGTTTLEIAKLIKDRTDLTVVTNSLLVAHLIGIYGKADLIFVGGFLRREELSFIGHITEQALGEINVDKIILGIPAIDVREGLSNDYLPEVMTDRTIINLCPELIIVADHTKFGKTASAFLAPINRISKLITDSNTDPHILEQLRSNGITVLIAD